MKNLIRTLSLLLAFVATSALSSAQTLRVWKNGTQLYSVEVSGVDSISFFSTENLPKDVAVPELVDLGLSVKWATFNLGATKPEEFGDYYMWGEATPATDRDCSWEGYSLANGTSNDDPKLTKYVPESEASKYGDNGFFDNKSVLDPEDDAAHVALGGKFRMPTLEEFKELYENCTWTWTQLNGVNGYLVTSKKDGFTDRSIFIPAAGFRGGSAFEYQGFEGNYWSASLGEKNTNSAYLYGLRENNYGWGGFYRYRGLPIRPVSE